MKNATDRADRKDTIAHKVGDKIERAGEKISNAGAPKVGQAIYKAGNKLEHSGDNKADRNAAPGTIRQK